MFSNKSLMRLSTVSVALATLSCGPAGGDAESSAVSQDPALSAREPQPEQTHIPDSTIFVPKGDGSVGVDSLDHFKVSPDSIDQDLWELVPPLMLDAEIDSLLDVIKREQEEIEKLEDSLQKRIENLIA